MNWIREVAYLIGTLIGIFLIFGVIIKSNAAPYSWGRQEPLRSGTEKMMTTGFWFMAAVNCRFFLCLLVS